jgi:hypothetical protein
MPPDAAAGPEGATDQTIAPEGPGQHNAEVEAAADIRDAAARLAIRAAGLGYTDFDDVFELIRAGGRLADAMVRGQW